MEKSRLLHNAVITENRHLCTDHYLLTLEEGELAKTTRPGQFINLKINNREELLLRRPFSVAKMSSEQSCVEIVYRIIGKGTEAMKGLRPGDVVDLIGPLGQGFHLPEQPATCLLIGGGVGLAPLWGLADQLSRSKNKLIALLGFRSSNYLFGIDVFKEYNAETIVATDDGSYGLKGLASEHVGKVLSRPIDYVYVCGPPLMLRAVVPMIRKAGLKGEVSVEEKMGCGYGVCLSCVVNVMKNGEIEKQRVCTEGPVFDIKDMVLDDET